MSGGVDSAVTAGLLREAGFETFGITLRLAGNGGRKGACCTGADVRDARRVADKLGIRHYVLDREARFREAVMEDFADSYLAGRTPLPCVRCNQRVKFADLLDVALDLGADGLATGHYARRLEGANGAELHRAVDQRRDQSYFLFATTRAQLRHLQFPLGSFPSKDEVRRTAARLELPVAQKPDSQDICFVAAGGYAAAVGHLRPGSGRSGPVRHEDGRLLGEHPGIERFTVGQRKGLGLGLAERLFVTRIDAASRTVTVGPQESLAVSSVRLSDINWIGDDRTAEEMPLRAQIRSGAAPVSGWLAPGPKDRADRSGEVRFAAPVRAAAPGQACVFLAAEGSRVLGGGWIEAARTAASAARRSFPAGNDRRRSQPVPSTSEA